MKTGFFLLFALFLQLLPSLPAAGNEMLGSIALEVRRGQARVMQKETTSLILAGEKWNTEAAFFLETAKSTEVLVKYLDGSAQLKIASNTRAEFAWNAVRLKQGDSWFRFIKRKDKFQIRTPTAVLGIRGTVFRVRVTGDGEQVDLLKGKLEISHGEAMSPLNPGETWQLIPGSAHPHGIIRPLEPGQSPPREFLEDSPDSDSESSNRRRPVSPVPDADSGSSKPGLLNMDQVVE